MKTSLSQLLSWSCSFKEVLLGVHAINKEENESRQKARVTHSYPHPCFDRKEAVNDLMLLKVRSHRRQNVGCLCSLQLFEKSNFVVLVLVSISSSRSFALCPFSQSVYPGSTDSGHQGTDRQREG